MSDEQPSAAGRPGVIEELQRALASDYLVERELGGGGMARVFLAEERRLGRRVVIKVIRSEAVASLSLDRFQREIRLAAQLQHPLIVPLLTSGQAGDLPFYTMPYVEGESLRARLAHGAVPLREALGFLRDMALALDYAHARSIAHRDIKPENVLITRHTAVVTDFGIAKAVANATADEHSVTMTGIGTVIGTPAYMAPEQVTGDPVDHRADLYAWGVTAYEMLTGVHPFGRASAQASMAAQLAATPVPLAERAPGLPAALIALVERAMAKDRNERPASAAEILEALDDLSPAAAGPGRGKPRRIAWRAAIGIGIAAAMAFAWLEVARRSSMRETGSARVELHSIAVLPFTSLDRDSANAYFGAGMAEELTTAFARVPGLRVASRGSAARFTAGTSETEIARQLGVATILEGTVRRAGDRIRVSARLLDPKDGTVLWADQYDRVATQVFDVQDEMAHAIVTALQPTLADTARLAAARALRGTQDLTAYDWYLKGRYYWGRRGETNLRTAIDYFQRAIDRDSTFARAWAGLSMAQVVLPFFASVSADSILQLAIQNAQHALRLDSTLADAQLARAYTLKSQWRWPESEREFQRALALAPEDATIKHWYGVLLYVTGRTLEGLKR